MFVKITTSVGVVGGDKEHLVAVPDGADPEVLDDLSVEYLQDDWSPEACWEIISAEDAAEMIEDGFDVEGNIDAWD